MLAGGLAALGAQLGERNHPAVPLGAVTVRVVNGGQVPVLLHGGNLGEVCRWESAHIQEHQNENTR